MEAQRCLSLPFKTPVGLFYSANTSFNQITIYTTLLGELNTATIFLRNQTRAGK
jgi:hypothetical protein